MSPCPSPQVLARLGPVSPGDTGNAFLDDHINGCGACQAFLDGHIHDEWVTTGRAGNHVPTTNVLPEIPGYEIERELGRGGMGVVHLAKEITPNRTVALKFLPGGPFAAPSDRERLLKEARAAARVRHPHIVQLYHVGEASGWLYLALEYVPGGSLQERLDGPVSPRLAATILASIAEALEVLHRAGIWHLDLKPANILIDAPPATPLEHAPLKLTDFGISRSLSDHDLTGSSTSAAQGTPSYMAPEQVTGRPSALGPRTDIHALGIILYELLTGRPPFLADSDAETMHRIQTLDPVPPRRLNPAIPRDLEVICLKCLEKDPGRRYISADAVVGDLRRSLDGRPISARPVSKAEHVWRWCRRRPIVAALSASLVFSSSAGFLAVILLWRYAEAERHRAQADFETANDILGQIVGLCAGGPLLPPVLSETSLATLLEQTRNRIIEIGARRPEHPAIARHLAFLDRRLGHALMQEGQLEKARVVFEESVRCWDRSSREKSLNHGELISLTQALRGSAEVADHQNRPDASVIHLRRAVDLSEQLVQQWASWQAIEMLADSRSGLARLLASQGDFEQARSLMLANLRLLENVPEVLDHPKVAARRVAAQIDFDRIHAAPSHVAAISLRTDGTGQPVSCQHLASPEADQLSDQAWAELATQSLHSPVRTVPAYVSEAGFWLIRHISGIAAEQRRSNKLEQAKLTVNRIVALGHLLVERHSDQPSSHLGLSEAYFHVSKNACASPTWPWSRKAFSFPSNRPCAP